MITFFVTDDAAIRQYDKPIDALRIMRNGELWEPFVAAGYDVVFYEDKSSGVVTVRIVPPIRKSLTSQQKP